MLGFANSVMKQGGVKSGPRPPARLQSGKSARPGAAGPRGPQMTADLFWRLERQAEALEVQNEVLREAQAELEASQSRYADLYDFAPVGFVTLDPKGRMVDLNLTAAALLGHEREKLRGLSLVAFLADSASLNRFGMHLRHCQNEKGQIETELDFKRRGAAFTAQLISHKEFDRANGAIQSVLLDISARVRAERLLRESDERFRQIAQNVDAVFYVTDIPNRQVRYVSPAYERLWGLDPDELYRDHGTWLKRIHPRDRTRTRAAYDRFLAGGPAYDVEYRLRLSNGNERWVRDRASVAARDRSGGISRVTGIAEDITERKQHEQEREGLLARLRQSHERLEQRVQERTAVLEKLNSILRAEMSERQQLQRELLRITDLERRRLGQELHDNLGQQLIGLSYLLKNLELDLAGQAAAREQTQKIDQMVSRAIDIVRDISRGLTHFALEHEELCEALGSLADSVRRLFGVSCRFRCPRVIGRLPLQPDVAEQWYGIAQEAVTNALKHGRAKRIDVSLSCRKGWLSLRVWNDGRPFRRRKTKGGLGLRIMNHRASVIGAVLKIAPHEEGTAVICTAPVGHIRKGGQLKGKSHENEIAAAPAGRPKSRKKAPASQARFPKAKRPRKRKA